MTSYGIDPAKPKYTTALVVKFIAFALPAVYSTLSKLWIAHVDQSMVVTLDAYTYIGVMAEVINEGLPSAAWLIIGDNALRTVQSRATLSQTLILVQASLGLIVSLIILGSAKHFAGAFVPEQVRSASLTYIRLSAFSTLSSAIEYAVSNATRALDHPEVPLIISMTKFATNIVLDMLFISRFHLPMVSPTVNLQAGVRLACDLTSALAGLVYFFWMSRKRRMRFQPSLRALGILLRPGSMTFLESAIRNALYLWLVSNIVSMGSDYATAWGIFNTIRWGLVMVPVQTLEATTLTFIGHRWGAWRRGVGADVTLAAATVPELRYIIKPAIDAIGLALLCEVPLAVALSTAGARSFAFYLSQSVAVSQIAAQMWRTIDWCYIFYAMSTQLAAILLATCPRWYLYQSLSSNILYVLPWAITCQSKHLDASNAWTYHALVFGGSSVFSFLAVLTTGSLWCWRLHNGVQKIDQVRIA